MPLSDIDPKETEEWADALASVAENSGPERVRFLLSRLSAQADRLGVPGVCAIQTPYVNTIPVSKEAKRPGDHDLERRIKNLVRWNSAAMVVRANRGHTGLGGHIASFASSATLYEVGFNHFFHAPSAEHGGDLVYIQGHSSPGIYSRAFLEGRLSADQLANFRREIGGRGLSSYPHPRLMPDFWQFPTVSMGLGPAMAIYQARFLKYLEHRGLAKTGGRKVWAFLGDGETDEPESLGAIAVAAREKLDNLIFVINCNLQRLDGPVRGNGKIIQELEGEFRGAGWNVIKVIWGANWDPLLAADHTGVLHRRMEEAVDGEYQAYKAANGAYVRREFFGKYPELLEMVADMTDDQIWHLRRGGHDPDKVYAAYAAAVAHVDQPTVILAKTVKGYGMGIAGEGQNITHQQKELGEKALRDFRDRFNIPIADAELAALPFYRPPDDSPEICYLVERRRELGGRLPARRTTSTPLRVPDASVFDTALKGSGEREISTTMALVRILTGLTRDPEIGRRIVPIIADEGRTFGIEGLFRPLGIYAPFGQKYRPVDADQLAYYHEDAAGQILEEGIPEAGAISSWMAAATSYSSSDLPMVPFYIYYSMFGFQRVGDFIWAAADMRARGFLIGATSGRTTLNGEGLQHQDGQSLLSASAVPSCIAYDPAFAYEVAVIVRDGLRRMIDRQEDVFYYVTTLNENYAQPALPDGVQDGICRGMYLVRRTANADGPSVQLLGSGAILREVLAAADMLEKEHGVGADVWSVTSFSELGRDGARVERHNRLHPSAPAAATYVGQCLAGHTGPVIAATDYVRAVPDQIRAHVPRRYVTLGTDGFGRSDTRTNLRRFFEVDRQHIALAALKALADEKAIDPSSVSAAIAAWKLEPDQAEPWTR
jgi:pyruvate dehydrogenase E1 component